jgi:GNAT superfamily N-acetyltransferase
MIDQSINQTFAEAADFFRTHLHSKVRTFTVQVDGKDIGGVLVIDGELTALRVDEGYRKLGIATALINMVKANYDSLTLICATNLIKFYQRHGFIVTGPYKPNGHCMKWYRNYESY